MQINAQPNSGSALQNWLGDTVGGSLSQTLVMSEDRVATAIFGQALPFVIVNSANNTGNPLFDNAGFAIAPGELVSLYGTGIGPSAAAVGQVVNGVLTTNLAGTRVLFDNVAAPILYASDGLINVVVPFSVGATPLVTVRVERNGMITSGIVISTTATAPGIFTADSSGRGRIAALNENLSLNSPSNPAAPSTSAPASGSSPTASPSTPATAPASATNRSSPATFQAAAIGTVAARTGSSSSTRAASAATQPFRTGPTTSIIWSPSARSHMKRPVWSGSTATSARA